MLRLNFTLRNYLNQFDNPLYGMKDYWMRTVMNGMHAHRSDDRAWQSGRFVLWQFVSHAPETFAPIASHSGTQVT